MRILRYGIPAFVLSTNLIAAPKIGGHFRGELLYNTNRSEEPLGAKADSLSSFSQLAYANFTAIGDISENVRLDSEVQFIASKGGLSSNCMGTPIKNAQVTWSQSEIFSVGFGCAKSKTGGWDFANYKSAVSIRRFNPANSSNGGNTSFSYIPNEATYNPSVELGLHITDGHFILQILNDTTPKSGWNTRARQTWNLEWKGNIAANVYPVVQCGFFDEGHSSHFDIGLMFDIGGFVFTGDYMMLSDSQKTPKADASGSTSKLNKSTRYSFEVSYDVNGIKPSFYYSSYLNKVNANDPGANSTPGTWDHEGQVLSLSIAATGISSNYSPYVAFDTQSGTFLVGGAKKTRTDMIARVGATARF